MKMIGLHISRILVLAGLIFLFSAGTGYHFDSWQWWFMVIMLGTLTIASEVIGERRKNHE
jgi:hypothetical protein